MNPQNYHNLPQGPHPGFAPLSSNTSASQHSLPMQPGQQVINPQGMPDIKINPWMMNPLNRQVPDINNTSVSSSESARTIPELSFPKYQSNPQFNPMQAVFPVKSDSNYQTQSSQQGPHQIPLSNQGIPLKNPSIPRQPTQNNIPASQGPPLMINPRVQGNVNQNFIPIKAPQFIPVASQINQTNQINPQLPSQPNLQPQISQPHQLDSQVPSSGSPPFLIKPPNQPNSQVPSAPSPQFQMKLPNQPDTQTPNLPGPQFQVKQPNQINQQNQLNAQIPSTSNIQFPANQIGQFNEKIQSPQNIQPPQQIPNLPRPQFVHPPLPQNMQEGADKVPSLKPPTPFTTPNFPGQNMAPPPLLGQNNFGFQFKKVNNQNPTPPIDESNKLVRPPPPPSFTNPQIPLNSPKLPQGNSAQIPENIQPGNPNFPLSGINAGPPFPQQVANSVEGSIPDIEGNFPQGNMPGMIRPPPQVNPPPQNVPNALNINPIPLRPPQPQDIPRFPPNNSQIGSPNPPFKFEQPSPPNLNQPFRIPQIISSSSSIDSDMSNYASPKFPPSDGMMQVETIPCPLQLANRLNSRNIRSEIKTKYNLVSVQYNSRAFILNGSSSSVQQASEELKKIITQESQLGNVWWEWLRDDGSFEPYPAALSEVIENAYNRKDGETAITIKNQPYKVCFGNPHVQVVSNSNISRTVRRNDGNQENVDRKLSENEVTWYWQDDDKAFKKYTAEASRQIEAAYRLRNKALVQGSNIKGYLIDFGLMIQQNERTKFKRNIRRGE